MHLYYQKNLVTLLHDWFYFILFFLQNFSHKNLEFLNATFRHRCLLKQLVTVLLKWHKKKYIVIEERPNANSEVLLTVGSSAVINPMSH